jgi:hypothetical protein
MGVMQRVGSEGWTVTMADPFPVAAPTAAQARSPVVARAANTRAGSAAKLPCGKEA